MTKNRQVARPLHSQSRIKRFARLGFALAISICPMAVPQAQNGDAAQALESDLQRSQDLTGLIEELEANIENIQSELGTYHSELLQPLDALARVYMEAENFESAAQLLDHQLQIHRINNGLYSPQQIPIVESLLQMQAQEQDWRSVSDTLDNLAWIYQRDTTLDAEAQLRGLQDLGSWHLRALENDGSTRQAYHLVELAKIEKRTAEIAERRFGEENAALTPYLYNHALADLYIALAITLTGETSQELMLLTEGIRKTSSTLTGNSISLRSAADIEQAYGSKASTVIERSFRNNMNENIEKIERIKELYVKNGNIEAEAMASMYLGDSNLIRQQFENRPDNFAGVSRGSSIVGSAMTHYREAITRFKDAGVSEEAIAAFTRCPVMLPVPKFYETVQEAIHMCEKSTEGGLVSLGEYNLVSTLIPGLEGESFDKDAVITATVKFAVRTNGQVSNDDIEEINPDDTASRVQVRKLFDIMQFRPAFIDEDVERAENLQLVIKIPNPH